MDYSKMTASKLKEECKKLGITGSLKKKDMIERLTDKLSSANKPNAKPEIMPKEVKREKIKQEAIQTMQNKDIPANLFDIPSYASLSENEKKELRKRKFGDIGNADNVLLKRKEKFGTVGNQDSNSVFSKRREKFNGKGK